jgi:NAD(P)-dependent dehydrogenase (short-subunit alcohol dehydrogenase family)
VSVPGSLQGKTIIVTGAGGGIGREACIVLARAGANVVVTDIAADRGRETAAAITGMDLSATFFPADLSTESDIRALVAHAVTTFGRLEQWERAIRIDLTSVFLCIKHQVMAMLKTGGGAIVNTASSLGHVAIPNASEYVSAKHGVVGLTRAAAAEYGRQGIRVNAVSPGIVLTPMISRLVADPQFSAFFEKVRERHPIGRFGQPGEIGEAVTWLLSDAASFVNGTALAVDGGYLAI